MDDAERWLYVNDPQYLARSEEWKHVKSGVYVAPAQEVPAGDAKDIERLLNTGEARLIKPVEWLICARRRCRREFQPVTPWQQYCSEFCQAAEKQRRRRARRRAA